MITVAVDRPFENTSEASMKGRTNPNYENGKDIIQSFFAINYNRGEFIVC